MGTDDDEIDLSLQAMGKGIKKNLDGEDKVDIIDELKLSAVSSEQSETVKKQNAAPAPSPSAATLQVSQYQKSFLRSFLNHHQYQSVQRCTGRQASMKALSIKDIQKDPHTMCWKSYLNK